jgi:Zn finger protein HypA/HybF involved in hydrogenase expression
MIARILIMKVSFPNLARIKCNRCGKIKLENATMVQRLDFENLKPKQPEKKKQLQERIGDWICLKCRNLNFSFRVVCNRCQTSKSENIVEIKS